MIDWIEANGVVLALAVVSVLLLISALRPAAERLRRQPDPHWQPEGNVSALPTAKRTGPPIRYDRDFARKNLLNHSETRLFALLATARPDCHVFPQVSFNALVTEAKWISQPGWRQAVRSQFNTRYVDFVVCRKDDFSVLAVVEYDGQGHNPTNDEKRDAILAAAGYRVERLTHTDGAATVSARLAEVSPSGTAPAPGDRVTTEMLPA